MKYKHSNKPNIGFISPCTLFNKRMMSLKQMLFFGQTPSPLICIHTLWMPPKYGCLLLSIIILVFCMLLLFNFSNIAKYIVATNKGEYLHIIKYTNNLRFWYSINVYLIVLSFADLLR